MPEKAQSAIQSREAGLLAGRQTARKQVTPARTADQRSLSYIAGGVGAATSSEVLTLQRTVGNVAVSRLIQTKLMVGPAGDRYEQEADRVAEQVVNMPEPASRPGAAPGGQAGVQRQAPEEEEVQTKPLAASITPLVQRQAAEEEAIQTKRAVQRQAAPEEEEAIQTQRAVQRQAAPEEEEELQTQRAVQRQAAPEEEEEIQTKRAVQRAPEEEEAIQTQRAVQRQAAPEEEEEIQTKQAVQRSGGGFQASEDLEQRLAAGAGGGSPLPAEVRAYMEPRFGADFSGVRVHADGQAAEMSRSVNAQAFTHGKDIYMGDGHYDAGSATGKRLLAHELTHVIQQNGE